MTEDEKWMQLAITEAHLAASKNEIPVGAVLIQNGIVIAKAHNQPISHNDPTAHAEILALRIGGEKQKNYRLINCTLYVTLEPCTMCFGAMIHARIKRIVFGALDPKTGVCGSCKNLAKESFYNHKILIFGGVLEDDCKKILQKFFKERRKNLTNIIN